MNDEVPLSLEECFSDLPDPLAFEHIRHYNGWADLNSIVRSQRDRRIGEHITQETAFWISSPPADAARLL